MPIFDALWGTKRYEEIVKENRARLIEREKRELKDRIEIIEARLNIDNENMWSESIHPEANVQGLIYKDDDGNVHRFFTNSPWVSGKKYWYLGR